MPLDRRLRDGLHREADSIEPNESRNLETVLRRVERRSSYSGALMLAGAAVIAIAVIIGIQPGHDDSLVPGASQQTPHPQGSLRPDPSLGDGLAGRSWTTRLADADPDVAALTLEGDWTVRFGTDAALDLTAPASFRPPSGAAPNGYVYTVTGASFLTNLFSRDYTESCTGPGTYDWSIEGDRLSFSGEDTCEARRTLLTTQPWSLVGPSD